MITAYLGPKSRAGLSEKPQLCPKDMPTAPMVKPMKMGAIPSATLFFLSVIAMMERTRIAVPTTWSKLKKAELNKNAIIKYKKLTNRFRLKFQVRVDK